MHIPSYWHANFTSSASAFTAMREQVIVLPPFVDRRTASFSLSKKEEALLNSSTEVRSWAIPEGENTELALIERHHKEVIHAELASAEHMTLQDLKEATSEHFGAGCEPAKQTKAVTEGTLSPERMRNSSCSTSEVAAFLQWGPGKRSRHSRADMHNPASGEDNHNRKHGSLIVTEPSSLICKTMYVQADRATAAHPNTSSHGLKGTGGRGLLRKREQLCSEDKQNQQAKFWKRCPSDIKPQTQRSPLREKKRGDPLLQKQHQLLHQQRKTCISNSPPKDQHVVPLPNSNNSKNELVWPKLVIGLSRKEKEEDFLILKGTKLPQRPKRRPKVVERALHYCTPGISLVGMSPLRYDVKETKRTGTKRLRGLKAMGNSDSNLD